MNEFYSIGKILSSGKDGFVKAQLMPGVFENREKIKSLFLDFWDQKKILYIEEVLEIKNSVFLKFQNFNDERETSLLIDRDIFLTEQEIRRLKINFLLERNFLGFKVFRNNNFLGTVSDFFDTPANSVITVSNGTQKEILIPFVKSFFEKIDTENKELTLKSDHGFYDDET